MSELNRKRVYDKLVREKRFAEISEALKEEFDTPIVKEVNNIEIKTKRTKKNGTRRN